MIVRNEAAVVARCLKSVRRLIDTWVIIDTGSIDDTEAVVGEALEGIPGEFLHRPWVNFGHNRTELIQHARGKADYLLLLDADMEIFARGFEKRFDADAYLLRYAGGLDYSQKLLVRSDLDWKYIGTTHEYLHCAGQQNEERLDAIQIVHHADGGCRGEKLPRDRQLLEQAVAENPVDARAVFYLAQTCRDAGDRASAIRHYRSRASMQGWDQEVWYATYQVGLLLEQSGRWDEALQWLLKAYELRPSRAEPLYAIARHYRSVEQYQLGYLFATRAAEIPYPDDTLFVERAVYDYGIDDERAICAYYVGQPARSSTICRNLLGRPTLPEPHRPRIEQNKRFADAQRKRLVFGLGSGRCGTMSLANLLNAQNDMTCRHESVVLPWSYHPTILDQLLAAVQSYSTSCAAEVGFFLLHYVEPILALSPDARFICLKRDKTATVDSYLRWTGAKNHWTSRWSRHWNDEWRADPFDRCYPQFDAGKRAGIEWYWDHYYSFAAYLERRHFDQFRIFPVDTLNSVTGQQAILSFAGISRDEMYTNPDIRENRGVAE